MNELEQIKRDIAEIKERNARVEKDKAWETSWARKKIQALEIKSKSERTKYNKL